MRLLPVIHNGGQIAFLTLAGLDPAIPFGWLPKRMPGSGPGMVRG